MLQNESSKLISTTIRKFKFIYLLNSVWHNFWSPFTKLFTTLFTFVRIIYDTASYSGSILCGIKKIYKAGRLFLICSLYITWIGERMCRKCWDKIRSNEHMTFSTQCRKTFVFFTTFGMIVALPTNIYKCLEKTEKYQLFSLIVDTYINVKNSYFPHHHPISKWEQLGIVHWSKSCMKIYFVIIFIIYIFLYFMILWIKA